MRSRVGRETGVAFAGVLGGPVETGIAFAGVLGGPVETGIAFAGVLGGPVETAIAFVGVDRPVLGGLSRALVSWVSSASVGAHVVAHSLHARPFGVARLFSRSHESGRARPHAAMMLDVAPLLTVASRPHATRPPDLTL